MPVFPLPGMLWKDDAGSVRAFPLRFDRPTLGPGASCGYYLLSDAVMRAGFPARILCVVACEPWPIVSLFIWWGSVALWLQGVLFVRALDGSDDMLGVRVSWYGFFFVRSDHL